MRYHCTGLRFSVVAFIHSLRHTRPPQFLIPSPRHSFIHSFIRASLLLTCLFCCFCCCCSWSCLPPSLSSRLPCSRAETSVFRPKGRYSYILLFFWGVRGRGFGGSGPFVAATCAPLPRYFSFFFFVCLLVTWPFTGWQNAKRLKFLYIRFYFPPFFIFESFFQLARGFKIWFISLCLVKIKKWRNNVMLLPLLFAVFTFVVLLTFSVLCTCLIFPLGHVVAALGFVATCLPLECFRVVFPKNENSAGMPRVIIMIAFENLCNFRPSFLAFYFWTQLSHLSNQRKFLGHGENFKCKATSII